MRAPEHYYPATRISAMSIPEDKIENLFNFDCNAINASSTNADLPRQQPQITQISAYQVAKRAMQKELNECIYNLNNFIGPDNKYQHNPLTPKTHRHLLKLIDDKIFLLFLQSATEADKARINSLRITGASSFLNVPVNPYFGVEYSNLQYFYIKSLYFGSRIFENNTICNRCKKQMDPHGWHALHCNYGPHMIHRHNAIRDQIAKYMKQARITHKLEQKYKPYDINKGYVEERQNNMIPGDITADGWYDKTPELFLISQRYVFCNIYIVLLKDV